MYMHTYTYISIYIIQSAMLARCPKNITCPYIIAGLKIQLFNTHMSTSKCDTGQGPPTDVRGHVCMSCVLT